MSETPWWGHPEIHATLAFAYGGMKQPLLDVGEIAMIAGLPKNAVMRRGGLHHNHASLGSSSRSSVEAATTAHRPGMPFYTPEIHAGKLHAGLAGPRLFALATYVDKAHETYPGPLYTGMYIRREFRLSVLPPKTADRDEFGAFVSSFVGEWDSATANDAEAATFKLGADVSEGFELAFHGTTSRTISDQSKILGEIFGQSVAFNETMRLFGGPERIVAEKYREATAAESPLLAARHILNDLLM